MDDNASGQWRNDDVSSHRNTTSLRRMDDLPVGPVAVPTRGHGREGPGVLHHAQPVPSRQHVRTQQLRRLRIPNPTLSTGSGGAQQ